MWNIVNCYKKYNYICKSPKITLPGGYLYKDSPQLSLIHTEDLESKLQNINQNVDFQTRLNSYRTDQSNLFGKSTSPKLKEKENISEENSTNFSPDVPIVDLPFDYSVLQQPAKLKLQNITNRNPQREESEFIDLKEVYKLIQKYSSNSNEKTTGYQ